MFYNRKTGKLDVYSHSKSKNHQIFKNKNTHQSEIFGSLDSSKQKRKFTYIHHNKLTRDIEVDPVNLIRNTQISSKQQNNKISKKSIKLKNSK